MFDYLSYVALEGGRPKDRKMLATSIKDGHSLADEHKRS